MKQVHHSLIKNGRYKFSYCKISTKCITFSSTFRMCHTWSLKSYLFCSLTERQNAAFFFLLSNGNTYFFTSELRGNQDIGEFDSTTHTHDPSLCPPIFTFTPTLLSFAQFPLFSVCYYFPLLYSLLSLISPLFTFSCLSTFYFSSSVHFHSPELFLYLSLSFSVWRTNKHSYSHSPLCRLLWCLTCV